MKKFYFILLSTLFILASCSTGNFAKRKYTKGKYKPEKGDYQVAKNDKKKSDTKYVVKTEKNQLKQDYKVTTKKNKKTEKTVTPKNEVSEVEIQQEENEIHVSENNNEVLVEDNEMEKTNNPKEVEAQENTETTASTPEPAPSMAGDILGYIGFALGILGLLFVILGAFVSGGLFWAGFAFALIALGVSIASWVIDGQSMWNLVGVITSAIAIAFSIIWLIIVAII